jgi:putative CocE/NonD family hydrolase
MIQRTPNDPAWYKGGLYHDDRPIGVPSFWFMSWYDVSIGPNLALFKHVREHGADAETRENQFAMVAPVGHCAYTRASENTVTGERSMGDARWDYNGLLYEWWDHWLKGEENGITDTLPKIRYYAMGKNEWKTASAWPPPAAEMVTYYLTSGGSANTLHGDGALTAQRPGEGTFDAFAYDPFDPVMSYGGNVCCIGGAIDSGSFDQQRVEADREDILVYTTEPFTEGVEVSGPIEVTLFVSSDAKDTDFTVKLLDVYPDGRAFNLDESIQRARYREGYEGPPVFMEPGEVYEVKVGPLSTSNVFQAGHSLRIEVSSSNFPRFTRNLNTGGNNYDETEGVVANNRVHHSGEFPSHIRVPVVRR